MIIIINLTYKSKKYEYFFSSLNIINLINTLLRPIHTHRHRYNLIPLRFLALVLFYLAHNHRFFNEERSNQQV